MMSLESGTGGEEAARWCVCVRVDKIENKYGLLFVSLSSLITQVSYSGPFFGRNGGERTVDQTVFDTFGCGYFSVSVGSSPKVPKRAARPGTPQPRLRPRPATRHRHLGAVGLTRVQCCNTQLGMSLRRLPELLLYVDPLALITDLVLRHAL